jgi:hypothetical protein
VDQFGPAKVDHSPAAPSKEIHTATHPAARLTRANASSATSRAASSSEDLAGATSAPTADAREELLSALAAEAAEEDTDPDA